LLIFFFVAALLKQLEKKNSNFRRRFSHFQR